MFLEENRTLLLNASFEPLRVVHWQRAFILVFQEKVEILEAYGFLVRTVSHDYQVPAVIRLRRWVNLKRRAPIIRFSRSNLYARDEYRCQYCCVIFAERDLTLDHVIPVVKGGQKTWENIVTACLKCNQKKGSKLPPEAGLNLLKKPRAPRWLPGMFGQFRSRSNPPEAWEPYLQLGPKQRQTLES